MNDRQTNALLVELRERISDIAAASQLLAPLVRKSGSQADREYLAAVNKSLYRLVRSLRHVDLCGEAAVTCEKATIDLAGLCRDLGRQSEDMAKMLEISFQWSLGESSVLSMADDHLLELALLNVLTNAFEAAGPGGQVSLKANLTNGTWRVTVEDTGPGLQAREEPDDPFLKLPGGVGLGLEVARKALSLHGGTLVLNNGGQGGVQAVVSIPVVKPDREDLLKTPQTPWDPWGGYSPAKVEFSHLLPTSAFRAEDVE